MSYTCSRHQWYSPMQPCSSCSIEQRAQSMGQSNQAAAMARMQAASRWPQDVFERLEGERDLAVKMAATYRVENEKLRAEHARFKATLEDIAAARGDLCEQTPYWAQWCLDGKDHNGRPLPTPSGSDDAT